MTIKGSTGSERRLAAVRRGEAKQEARPELGVARVATAVAIACGCLAMLVFPGRAAAAPHVPGMVTAATMLSEGEYIGGTAQRLYHPGNGSISVGGTEGYISVAVSGGTHGDSYSMSFAAPDGGGFSPGLYEGAQRTPFRDAGRPGISISGSGRGCNTITGRFDIKDIHFDENGSVDRLWLVYEQHCEGGANALFGEVLLNQPPQAPDLHISHQEIWWPDEDPGRAGATVPVFITNVGITPRTLSAARIEGRDDGDFSIGNDSCAGEVLSPDELCRVWVRFRPTVSGPRAAQLTIREGGAPIAKTTLSGTGSPGETSLSLTSGPSGPTGGASLSYDTYEASISGTGRLSYADFTVKPDAGGSYYAHFEPGDGDVLGSGRTYVDPPGGSSGDIYPYIRVYGSGYSCSTDGGTFTVNSVRYAPDETLRAADISFSQRCSGASEPVTGRLRYRAGGDGDGPDRVSGVTVVRSGSRATLSWSNPSIDFDRAVVRYAEGGGMRLLSPQSGVFGAIGPIEEAHIDGLTPGRPVAFSIFTVDRHGNYEEPYLVVSEDDGATVPGDLETRINSAPPVRSASADATFAFTSGDPGAGFECKLDGGAFEPCSSPLQLSDLADGAHRFQVRSVLEGEVETTPATYEWSIDTERPSTLIVAGPPPVSADASAAIDFVAEDEYEEVEFACSLDGAAFTACGSPLELGGLTDGEHEVRIRATDAHGNVEQIPASHLWSVDTVAPVATIDSGPGASSGSSVQIGFSADDPEAEFECRLDSAAWAACESPVAYYALEPGEHQFRLRAFDAVGNASVVVQRTWTVSDDGAGGAVETSIDGGPPLRSTSQAASFSFSSSSSEAEFECRLDAAAFSPCESPLHVSELSEGEHSFEVRASAGEEMDPTPARHDWEIDVTPPRTLLISVPPARTDQTSAAVQFRAEPGDEDVSFSCRLDDGPYEACQTPFEVEDLADGMHEVRVRATDGFGNSERVPAIHTWEVDTTSPTTAIDSAPADGSGGVAEFAFFSDDPEAEFLCRLDRGQWLACDSPAVYEGLPSGRHLFEVRSVDSVGNVGAAASHSWNVEVSSGGQPDRAAPSIRWSERPPKRVRQARVRFEFSADEPAAFQCRLDGGAKTACTSPHRLRVPVGRHRLVVLATDRAGNTATSLVRWQRLKKRR
jgi:hypothetical protein